MSQDAPLASDVAAGWYPNPEGDQLRWWDGARWTGERTARTEPVAALDGTGYEYIVVMVHNLEAQADPQAVLTQKLNAVAEHGWRLVEGPRFELGLMSSLACWVATFERPRDWSQS